MTSWYTDMAASPHFFCTEDFDQSTNLAIEPTPPLPEIYTAEQMAECREAAWRKGHAAGLAAGAAGAMHEIHHCLGAIADAMRAARADLLDQAEATALELSRLLLAAFSVALPDLYSRHGMAEIKAIATEILPALSGELNIRVQTGAAHFSDLRQHISDLDADLLKNIHLQHDTTMGPSDIIIRWEQGEATRGAGDIWRSIQSRLDPQGLRSSEPVQPIEVREPAHVE